MQNYIPLFFLEWILQEIESKKEYEESDRLYDHKLIIWG